MNPSLQGSSVNLQGGTGISLGNYNPQGIGINTQPAGGISLAAPKPTNVGTQALQSAQQQGDQTAALIAAINAGNAANQKVYAPKLDIASLNAQARASAENAVNPYYTKVLNDFLGQQAIKKQEEQQQTDMNIKNAQDALKNATEGNAISGQRTSEDAALKQADINNQSDIYQTDQGKQFDVANRTQAVNLAKSGLTTSGLGQGQTADAIAQRDTTETNQSDQYQQSRDQAALLKSRSLDDLLRSNELATTAEGKTETQAKFDLDKFIQGQAADAQNQRNALEEQRLSRVASETQNQSKLAFNNWLSKISNPAQYNAAIQTYGGLI